MKHHELFMTLVFVALVSMVVTIAMDTMIQTNHSENFEDQSSDGFTNEEKAKLTLLRDTNKFILVKNSFGEVEGITVNMPVWTKQELRITNAPSNGALTLSRTDGTSASVIQAVSQGSTIDGLFTAEKEANFNVKNARDLIIKNGNGTEHRIQPYSLGFKPPVENMYLASYPTDPMTNKLHSQVYTNKQDAFRECTRIATTGGECSGITLNPETSTYTVRVGEGGLKDSSVGELSIVRY